MQSLQGNPPQGAPLPPGTVLRGHYRIEHTISQGGFGNVYRATDLKSGQDVAIKEAFYSDEETRRQFDIECGVLIGMRHGGVVRGLEDFEENGRFYLVMQYIPGPNLEELQIDFFKRMRMPIPEAQVLRIMAQICDATEALHAGHVLHRDIKPANIKLTEAGDPILLDLGLAKLFKDPGSVTLIAARAYTPGYAPPEQCSEEGASTERTDIYALGATTYYALTGRQPWESIRRLTELSQGHPDMPPPSAWIDGLHSMTDAVVMHALELDPSKRYPSAADMRAALLEALAQLGSPVTESVQTREIICANCGAANSTLAAYCGTCGAALRQPAARPAGSISAIPTAVVTPPAPQQAPLPAASPVPAQPAPLPRTKALPSLPERQPPRKLVTVRPRPSLKASVALLISALALCPAGFWLAFIAIPMSVSARRDIVRSRGTLRGTPRTVIAFILGLCALAEAVFWLSQILHGKFLGA
jgi:serine/threonine protein kinase